jgi:hypothetical protein
MGRDNPKIGSDCQIGGWTGKMVRRLASRNRAGGGLG